MLLHMLRRWFFESLVFRKKNLQGAPIFFLQSVSLSSQARRLRLKSNKREGDPVQSRAPGKTIENPCCCHAKMVLDNHWPGRKILATVFVRNNKLKIAFLFFRVIF
jgi:hypothetical protein